MVNKFRTIYALLLIILFSACSTRPSVPSEYPDEKEMEEILSEMHMMESTILNIKDQKLRTDSIKSGYYKFILEKHLITKGELDSAVKWYSDHPKIYSEIYENVIASLEKKEAVIKNAIKVNEEKEKRLEELMKPDTLWVADKVIKITNDSNIDSLLHFKLDLDTIKAGKITYEAIYKFINKDSVPSIDVNFFATYRDSVIDTIHVEFPNILSRYKRVSHVYELTRDTNLISVEGALLKIDSLSEVIEIRNAILKYNQPIPDEY